MEKKQFTLNQLLIVLGIICLVLIIVLPIIGFSKEGASRRVCSANLKKISDGMSLYLQDNDDRFPKCYDQKTEADGVPRWQQKIYPYINDQLVFQCPNRPVIADTSLDYKNPESFCATGPAYGLNSELGTNNDDREPFKKSQLPVPGETYLVMEATGGNLTMRGVIEPNQFEGSIPGLGNLYNIEKEPHPYGNINCDEDFKVPRHGNKIYVAFADGHVAFTKIDDIRKEASRNSVSWLGK